MSQLQVDDCNRVRTGSVIPVDGQITEGEAYINEASMTGEPLAVMKSAGASVFAGTVVEEGSVVIKVRKLSSDTKISKIIELIDNSENLKAGVQSKAERLADSIVPYSFLAFGLTLLFTRNVTKAVSVLMVGYYLFKHRLSVCKSAGLVKNDRIGKCVFFKIFSALYRNVIISGFFNSGYNGYRC